ncbi:hypothetical protein EHI44_35025 [Rhizobium leguminosarum]|uniref:hypothetical protein n=1 Tax=Rhizobium leguminosarum TaxID=384 RepID=UPI000FF35A62|nr:hypothetical protein [Rhizobium leguminosarum]RWY76350.1 hypothetical protein EHI44_35025 [Rhizobium leguminosarum]
MKSPWKFLAELTSRTRRADVQKGLTGHEVKGESSQGEGEQTPSNLPNGSDGPTLNEHLPVDDLSATTSPVAASDVVPVRAASEPMDFPTLDPHEDGRPSPPPASKAINHHLKVAGRKSESAKGVRADAFVQNTTGTDKQQPRPLISPHESFFASVMSLDEEIKQLKKQLAEKLHLQNVQLKRMLARFDGS